MTPLPMTLLTVLTRNKQFLALTKRLNRDATTSPWVDGDSFRISWVMTTADGRIFDTWNDSICLEFPGANCTFNLGGSLFANYSDRCW